MHITACSRDKKAWGDDACEFKLRNLETYEKLSHLWAEKAIDHNNPANSRGCPGKQLSLDMIIGFLRVLNEKINQFEFDSNDIFLSKEVSPLVFPKELRFPEKFKVKQK